MQIVVVGLLNEDRIGGLFRVILNILFVTFFIEGIGAYFIYMDIRGVLPGATTQDNIFFAIFHAVSAFCNAIKEHASDDQDQRTYYYYICMDIDDTGCMDIMFLLSDSYHKSVNDEMP